MIWDYPSPPEPNTGWKEADNYEDYIEISVEFDANFEDDYLGLGRYLEKQKFITDVDSMVIYTPYEELDENSIVYIDTPHGEVETLFYHIQDAAWYAIGDALENYEHGTGHVKCTIVVPYEVTDIYYDEYGNINLSEADIKFDYHHSTVSDLDIHLDL